MKTAGSVLFSVLKDLGIEEKVKLDTLRSQWSTVFSEPLSAHTYPADLKNGEILINVDSPAWMQQLKFFKQDIIGKLRSYSVKTVRFRHGGVYHKKGRDGAAEPWKKTRPLTDTERKWIDTTLSELQDPELREGLKLAMEKALSRGKG